MSGVFLQTKIVSKPQLIMKLLKSVILLVSLASSAFGATISFYVAENTYVATSAGAPLSSTYTAYIGTYTGSGLDPATATFADIFADFDIRGTATFATGLFPAGLLGVENFEYTVGEPIYAFFTNGGNENALITGFSVSPNGDDNFAAYINVGNAADLTYLVGGYDPEGADLYVPGAGNVVLNNAIPEPSTTLLGALGGLFLLRRRRRI
jgi:hypothetical protein